MRILTGAVVLVCVMSFVPERLDHLQSEIARQEAEERYRSAVTLAPVRANVPDRPRYRGNVRDFLNAVGRFESGNKYNIVSRNGIHLGRYQFHPNTIKVLGFDVTPDEFLNNPALQDRVMLRYMRDNEVGLHDLIDRWVGKTYRGVKVTRSGIVAGAHFAGSYGLRTWFYPERYNGITRDSNGADVGLYLKRFANYNLDS